MRDRKEVEEKKKDLRSQIMTYEKRRQEYLLNAKSCSKRLKLLRDSLKLADVGQRAKKEEISKLGIQLMQEFNGLLLKNSAKSDSKLVKNSIGCLIKWTLENNGSRAYLAEYLGYSRDNSITTIRRRFTRSFQTNDDNKQFYLRFKNFAQDEISNMQSAGKQDTN